MRVPNTLAPQERATDRSAARMWTAWAVVAIAAGGCLLRAFPLIQAGPFGYPVDYDEGVYFASSSLLLRGALPYRDFAFVHPPGGLYCLLPAAWLGVVRDPAFGFAIARWLGVIAGTANVLLLGRVAMRAAGPACAIAAALVYATHPAAVSVERGPFLEPLLNLFCLGLAWTWLADMDRKRSKVIAAGAWCGLAISVKLLGGLWLLPCALAGARQTRREWLVFVATAGICVAAVTSPLALAAPAQFLGQAISFHLQRPADGPGTILNRLGAMFWMHGQWLKSALVVVGLALALSRARDPRARNERFFSAAFLAITGAFLLSTSYWAQYNAHLAVAESLLAGYAAAALWTRASLSWLAVALVGILGARRAIATGLQRSPQLAAVGSFVRGAIPPSSPVLSFEPAWLIAAGRLPGRTGGRLIVDPYAAMLMDATRGGRRFASATQAFADPSSQAEITAALRAARFAIVGDRGRWQMSAQTQDWFGSVFVQRFPPPGEVGVDVWERLR